MRSGRSGRSLSPVRLFAAMAALCLLWSGPAGMNVFAEDAIVADDDSTAIEEGSAEETAPSGATDPAQVDGLFEVISESSGFDGDSTSNSKGKKDKKNEKKLIVGYKQVGAQASIRFEMGEKPSLDRLLQQFPSKLDVYFLGEKKAETVSVTWESYGDDYSTTNLNYYFFTPKFDAGKYEVKGLNLQSESPYIEVIQNAFTYEMIESAPPKENEAAVVEYCRKKLKLNTAAICGILANIYCESGFRTNAIGDGGTSVGICQWHNGRWTNLKNYAPDDWQTLEGQLRFMRRELRGGYRSTLKYLQNVTDDEQGAYDAAYYWCMHYEMPDKIVSRSTTRGYLAKNVYWKRYGIGEEETETETSEELEDGALTDEPETAGQPEDGALTDEPETAGQPEDGALTDEPETAGQPEDGAVTDKLKVPEKREEEAETESRNAAAETESREAAPETESRDAAAEAESREAASEKNPSGRKAESRLAGSYRCLSDNGLFIRSEKSTDSKAVGSIPFDAVVTVSGGDGEWAQVSYDGQEGYSKLEFLEKISDEKDEESKDSGTGSAKKD